MINFLIFCLIAVGSIYSITENAVYGYEDERGFHYGKDPLDKE